jgi:hypothetical protein
MERLQDSIMTEAGAIEREHVGLAYSFASSGIGLPILSRGLQQGGATQVEMKKSGCRISLSPTIIGKRTMSDGS